MTHPIGRVRRARILLRCLLGILLLLIPADARPDEPEPFPAHLRHFKDDLEQYEHAKQIRVWLDRLGSENSAVQQQAGDELAKDKTGRSYFLGCLLLIDLHGHRPNAKKALDYLLAIVKDEGHSARASAIFALRPVGAQYPEQVVPVIISALDALQPNVRRRAARSLAAFGPQSRNVVSSLVKRLSKEEESDVRLTVIETLGSIGPCAYEATGSLIGVLKKEHDWFIRHAVIEALSSILRGHAGNQTVADALASELRRSPPDDESLSPTRLAVLLAFLELPEQAKRAVPAIAELLHDPNAFSRGCAAQILGSLGDDASSAADVLAKRALDDDPFKIQSAQMATWALGRMPSVAHQTVRTLIHAIQRSTLREVAEQAFRDLGTAAVPPLIELLKTEDRKHAAHALGLIGPPASEAAKQLGELLRDEKKCVREAAVLALVQLKWGASGATTALTEALDSLDPDLSQRAAMALGNVGPSASEAAQRLGVLLKDKNDDVSRAALEALVRLQWNAEDATTALITALNHRDPAFREFAAKALGNIGATAEGAVDKLIICLKPYPDPTDGKLLVDVGLRSEAARALGRVGAGSKRAIPCLVTEIHEGPAPLVAAEAVASIASGLATAKDTTVIAELENARDACKKCLATLADTWEKRQMKTFIDTLNNHISYLQLLRDNLWHNRLLRFLGDHKGIATIVFLYFIWGGFVVTVWLWSPVHILNWNQGLKNADIPLPNFLGAGVISASIPIGYILLLGLLHYHPRVLDAWVAQYIEHARRNFDRIEVAKQRSIHVSLPVEFDGRVIDEWTASKLRAEFDTRKRKCYILIRGQGGAGKTSLACQMAKWAMAEHETRRLATHPMLPAFIEEELDDPSVPDEVRFMHAIRGKLQTLIGEAVPIPPELLTNLLRQKRVIVIVDRFSEMTKPTREQIRPQSADFPATAFVLTSRHNEALGNTPKTSIRPVPIAGNGLVQFMQAYLTQRGKRHLLDDNSFLDACLHFSRMVGKRSITVLLARLFADQLAARKLNDDEQQTQLRLTQLPCNIPELMLSYVNQLHPPCTIAERILQVQRDAMAVAWECLRKNYCPGRARRDDARRALEGDDANERLAYLEKTMRLVRSEGAHLEIRFILDPLAEYLAGMYLVNERQDDNQLWTQFFEFVAPGHVRTSEITSFLLAVRDCCSATHVEVPQWVPEKLAELGGLDVH